MKAAPDNVTEFRQPTDRRRYVDAKVVGEVLGVNPNTVYRWARAEKIPSYRFVGLRRFVLAEVLAWAESHRRSPTRTR